MLIWEVLENYKNKKMDKITKQKKLTEKINEVFDLLNKCKHMDPWVRIYESYLKYALFSYSCTMFGRSNSLLYNTGRYYYYNISAQKSIQINHKHEVKLTDEEVKWFEDNLDYIGCATYME